jgi:hypothetical protein
MTDIQELWRKGFLDGWDAQGVHPTSEPTIPPLPSIPSGVSDTKQWAYDEGKSRGALDRLKKQAGLS